MFTTLLAVGAVSAFAPPRVHMRNSALRMSAAPDEAPASTKAPHVAVIGGGWAGWGAAKAALAQGCRVTLLDAQPDPTGATPMRSRSGRPVEPGVRGFWKDYPNIEAMLGEVGVDEDDVFTDFTNSSFWSPDGLEATAPVFSKTDYAQLPSPLGQVLATFPLFERLPLADRASMVGLLVAVLDLYASGPDAFAAYDRMTADELFRRFGLSKGLVDTFIRPTLLVGLFKPPEELSAAVTMELLYYYALAHQDSFDVRWLRRPGGSVAADLIAPLAASLEASGQLAVKAARVAGVDLTPGDARLGGRGALPAPTSVRYTPLSAPGAPPTPGGDAALDDVDGVVLAVGVGGMRAICRGSPALAAACPEISAAASLGAVDVISVRLWLDRRVATRTPANVLSRFEGLRGAGGTYFMLDQLQTGQYGGARADQDAELSALWAVDGEVAGGEAGAEADGEDGAQPLGSVVACDFYNAGALLPLADEEIVELLLGELLPAAEASFRGVRAVDAWVGKYPQAVSWFSPGSFAKRPPLEPKGARRVRCAGDWARLGEKEHGAKGLCQERAFVSGLHAANELVAELAAAPEHAAFFGSRGGAPRPHPVIEVRDDEPQFVAGRELTSRVASALRPLGLVSPWLRRG